MPFATPQEMESALGRVVLTDIADDDQDGSWDEAVVLAALAESSSLCESYVHAYMPLAFTPTMLRRATIMIAAQFIRLPRGRSTDDSKQAYKDSIAWLESIADGTVQLVPPTSEDPGYIDPGDPEMASSPRVWSRSSARGMF